MRGLITTIVSVAVVLSLLAPVGIAPPSSNGTPGQNGLDRACTVAVSQQPCARLGVISGGVVAAGENVTYANRTYRSDGTVFVSPGARVTVDNATISFTAASRGFVVAPGGELLITASTLQEADGGSEFGIDAQRASRFKLVGSSLLGGSGIRLATDDAEVHDDTIANIPVALRNEYVNVTIYAVNFQNNTVSVNNTGGFPQLHNNTFQGGATCVRDWLSDPTIVYNTFRGCHVGIYHHRSESKLSFNDMSNDAYPPGGGIIVEDTMSPTIEGNEISNYGTGIIIRNARAYIRNNTIHDNVLDGILIENNSAPMDVQGNEVYDNGRIGIALFNVTDVPVTNNGVWGHGAQAGIFLNGAVRSPVESNRVHQGLLGISVHNAPGQLVAGNTVNDTTQDGIWVGIGTTGANVSQNTVQRSGYGIVSDAASTELYANDVLDAGIAGVMLKGDASSMRFDSVTGGARGIGLVDAANVQMDFVVANGNALMGVWIDGGSGHTLRNVNASENGDDGFVVYNNTSGIALLGARALGNGGSGLRTLGGNTTYAYQAWWEGNTVAGVENEDPAVTIASESAWWGSASGPTHADNPGGDGDAVVGNVDYVPYLESPPGPYFPAVALDTYLA